MARPKNKIGDANDLQALLELWRKGKLKYFGVEELAGAYEQIIDYAVDGYEENVVTPKGDPVLIVKRDLSTGVRALKEYRDLVERVALNATQENPITVSITLKEAQKPKD